MQIYTMLSIVMLLLSFADVGAFIRKKLRLSRKAVTFFCVATFVLSLFELRPASELVLIPICIIIPIWLQCTAFYFCEKRAAWTLPFSIVLGLTHAILGVLKLEGGVYVSGLLSAAICLVFPPISAMTAVALTPLFVEISEFVVETIITGYSVIELAEDALAAQLVGICALYILLGSKKDESVPKAIAN